MYAKTKCKKGKEGKCMYVLLYNPVPGVGTGTSTVTKKKDNILQDPLLPCPLPGHS